ncbi:MAG TPA: hypothetical protein VK629_03120 [Steroidobacteraceae bacterium]|nr:hypothetical protein [Steroidobacteraceae bacterium]
MAKNKRTPAADTALDLAHGGRRISPAAMKRALGSISTRSRITSPDKLKLSLEAEEHRQKLRAPLGRDAAKAFAGMDRIANGIAKRKLKAPAVKIPAGGLLGGSYSLRLTPGYDFGDLKAFPNNGRNKAFVRRSTGNMGCTVVSESKDDWATAVITLGAFFIPLFGPARVRASINPSLVFASWVNSTGAHATTLAQMRFTVSAHKPDGSLDLNVHPTGALKSLWFMDVGIGLDFDIVNSPDNPMQASVDVDTNHFYLYRLECLAEALSFAQKGNKDFKSNCGGILDVQLPFISLDLQTIPVISQG